MGYGIGECTSFGLFINFIMYFYTDILHLNPLYASAIFLIARVWGAVSDIFFASYVDMRGKKSELGKFRFFLKYAPFAVFVTTVLSFLPLPGSQIIKILWAITTYIIWAMAYTVSDISFFSMSSMMSKDPQKRTSLISFAMVGMTVGNAAISQIFFTPMKNFFGKDNEAFGVFITVIIIMTFALLLMFNGFLNIKERVEPKKHVDSVKASVIFKNLIRNKSLILVLISYVVMTISNIMSVSLYIYYFKWSLNSENLIVYIGYMSLVTLPVIFVVPKLIFLAEKKNLVIIISILDVTLRCICYFLNLKNPYIMIAFISVFVTLNTAVSPLISSMIADSIDYMEYKIGRRMEAIGFSGITAFGKIATALSGVLIGFVISFLNYDPSLKSQNPFFISGVFFFIFLFPAATSLLRIFCMYFYTFTSKEHEKVIQELLKREKQN